MPPTIPIPIEPGGQRGTLSLARVIDSQAAAAVKVCQGVSI
jgi:hypothetical protein